YECNRCGQGAAHQSIAPSLDGRYFFYVSIHGDLESDVERYELEVFAAEDLLRVLPDLGQKERRSRVRAIAVARLSSHVPAMPAIQNAQWEPDSSSVLFLSIAEDGTGQVYRLDVHSGKLIQLTSHPTSIGSFSFRNGGLVFTSR